MDGLNRLGAALRDFTRRFPEQATEAGLFLELLAEGAHAFRRERNAGHFTASAWLVSADGCRALLTHHRQLDRWFQPGGHADGDMDLARVALREAGEESGLDALEGGAAIFDIDRHCIPARPNVPEHWHFDVRYVIRARGSEAYVVSVESHDLAWCSIEGLAADPSLDASVRRMARRWLQVRDLGAAPAGMPTLR